MDPQAKQGVNSDAPLDDLDPTPHAKPTRNVSDFYRAHAVRDRRIHILGIGSIGTFIAHALRGIPNPPPLTLLFHKPSILREWNESPHEIRLTTEGKTERRSGFDAELAIHRTRFHHREVRFGEEPIERPQEDASEPLEPQILDNESSEPIHSLILTCKAPQVLGALSSVKHRLHPESVILFLQNGLGTIDEVNAEIFPDPATRPHYMVGVNSHGVNRSGSGGAGNEVFSANHAGFGTISLGILPHIRTKPDAEAPYAPNPKFTSVRRGGSPGPVESSYPEQHPEDPDLPPPGTSGFRWTPNSRYLLRTLLRSPVLCATAFSPADILQLQLEKLAVNSIINPLTAMLDARNGSVLYNYHLTRAMRLLLAETSLVIRSLPELAYIPNVAQRFDPGRLETLVVGVANKTRDNISSMLADVRAGRKTEVEYINGWIVKKGEELGVRCVMNYLIMQLVKGKQGMISLEVGDNIPFIDSGDLGNAGKRDDGGNLRVNEGISVSAEELEKVKEGSESPVVVEEGVKVEDGAAPATKPFKGDVKS